MTTYNQEAHKKDKVNLLALDELVNGTKSGLIGQIVISIFVALFLKDFLPIWYLVIGLSIHFLLLLTRFQIVIKYKKIRHTIKTYAQAKSWLRYYMMSIFSTSLAWSSILIFMNNIDLQYQFFIYALILGMNFAAVVTLGYVIEVFVVFTLPMVMALFLTFVVRDGLENNIATLFIAIAHIYAFLTAYKLSKNFRSMSFEKEVVAEQAYIIEQIQDIVISTDLDGIITTWNNGATKQLEYEYKEVIGKNVSILHSREEKETLVESIKKLKEQNINEYKSVLITKSGKLINVEISLSLLKDENNVSIGIIGNARNIDKRVKAEQELENSNYNLQQYLDAIDKIEIGLFVVDDDYSVRYMNSTMVKWFGDQSQKVCYSSVANLKEPCSYCKLHEVIHDNKKVIYEPTTENGESFDIIATSIRNSDGTMSKMEVIRNITAQKNMQKYLIEQKEVLNYQAHHDVLTGLPNRILFNDRLMVGLEKAKRNGTILALFFIDLDHFKEINDSLGHKAGDDILIQVTEKLENEMRKEDTIARLGGDEFTIIMQDLKQINDVSKLAQKIINIVQKPFLVEDKSLYITASIGISLYPDDGDNSQDLLKFSDAAMYKAKNEGRNNFQFYSSELTQLALDRVMMETSLRQAIRNEEFVVYYQPQINASTDEIIGMEALVRWEHPEDGLVSPAKFIPLAESTGLIIELDQLVMKSAMKQIVLWYENGLNPGKISLNLAIKQLEQENFVDILQLLLNETHCKAEWVELEVTEGQLMTNPSFAIEVLKNIKNMGINLAIDDFGTGYSSLSYLKKLSLDKLKIDQSFVKDLPYDNEDSSIVKAIIALAKSLNLNVIAEGVETKEQRDFLLNNECENIQGYFYAKPMPSTEMEQFLHEFSHKILTT